MENAAGTRGRGGKRQLARIAALLLCGGTLVVTLHAWLGLGPAHEFLIGEALYDGIVIAAGLACLIRAATYVRERWAWLLIGLAILSWGAGELYWTAAIADEPSAPYPSPADAAYLAFYPLAYAGLAMLVRARVDEMNWRLWMDGVIAALGTAALGAAFVFDFALGEIDGTTAQVAVTLAYPLGDIAMLGLVVGVVALTGWRPGFTWSMLLAGLTALAVADIAYTLQSNGDAFSGGAWINPIYLAGALFLSAAVWRPTEAAQIRPRSERERRPTVILPVVFAAVMIGLFALRSLGQASELSTILWAAAMTAVVVRLTLSDRENKALLEAVRTDALTGLGNRGRMQVDLPGRFDRCTEDRPLRLVLFDLNGFKQFNDTFGHAAGDDVLRELGGSLQSALGDRGMAYRIGGDEFCVLLTGPERDFESLTRSAAMALSTSGPGYRVTASWGIAEVPAEGRDPAAALALADRRMYRQKGIGRFGDESIFATTDVAPNARRNDDDVAPTSRPSDAVASAPMLFKRR